MKDFLSGIALAINPTVGLARLKNISSNSDYRSHWYAAGAYIQKAYNEQTSPLQKSTKKSKSEV